MLAMDRERERGTSVTVCQYVVDDMYLQTADILYLCYIGVHTTLAVCIVNRCKR